MGSYGGGVAKPGSQGGEALEIIYAYIRKWVLLIW